MSRQGISDAAMARVVAPLWPIPLLASLASLQRPPLGMFCICVAAGLASIPCQSFWTQLPFVSPAMAHNFPGAIRTVSFTLFLSLGTLTNGVVMLITYI